MVSVNWFELIRLILLILGGLGTAGMAVSWAQTGKTVTPKTPSDPSAPPAKETRSADALPPDGAQEWVEDIWLAMSGAAADSVIASLRAGDTRDKAQRRRIAELEGPKP